MARNIKAALASNNIYSDLGLDDSEELQIRALLGFHLLELLKAKTLKQREIGELLGIKQAEVSHFLNGHFSRFTVDKLLEFLKCLDQTVSIRISPHKQGEPYQHVGFGS